MLTRLKLRDIHLFIFQETGPVPVSPPRRSRARPSSRESRSRPSRSTSKRSRASRRHPAARPMRRRWRRCRPRDSIALLSQVWAGDALHRILRSPELEGDDEQRVPAGVVHMTIHHQTDNLNRQSRPKKVSLKSTFASCCAVFDQNSKNDRMWRPERANRINFTIVKLQTGISNAHLDCGLSF